jgi:TPR repeat protein
MTGLGMLRFREVSVANVWNGPKVPVGLIRMKVWKVPLCCRLSQVQRIDFQKGLDAVYSGDYATALREWRDLAQQGDASAQYNLGNMYRIGLGVTQEYVEAAKWLRLAAEQGNTYAQLNLGVMYALGQGVAQNYITAHMWSNISGASGTENAVDARDEIAKQMTPTQIAEAQKLAREWMEKHPRQ